MSAVRILVLGIVHQHGQAHGYQVRRELMSWRVDAWAKIAPGSIYQALRTLTKRCMLEPAGTEAGSGGPERSVFRLTPDGETELFHLLRLAVTDPDSGVESLNAAFAFLHLLPRREVPSLLDYRVRALRARIVEIDPDVFVLEDDTPPQVEALGRLYTAQTRTEIEWSVELAGRIRDGAYRFADDPANQA